MCVTITLFSWMEWQNLQRNLVGMCGCRNDIRAQVLHSKERRILVTTGRHSATLHSTEQCKIWILHFNTGETKVSHWAHTSISHTQPHILIPSSAFIVMSSFHLLCGLPSARFPKKLALKILGVGLSEPYVYPAGFNFRVSNRTKICKWIIVLRKFKSISKLDSHIFVDSLRHEKQKQHFAWALDITFRNNWAPRFNHLILLARRANLSSVLYTQSSVYMCSSMKNRRRPWYFLTQIESHCSILSNQLFFFFDRRRSPNRYFFFC